MTTLLLLIALAMGDPNEVMLPKAIHMMWYRDVVVSVDVTDANEIAPHKWDLKGDVKIMTYPQSLGFIAEKWTKPFTLDDFVFLAKSWPQPVTTLADAKIIKSDPNAIEKPVCFQTVTGGKAHLYLDCRYMYSGGQLKEWQLCDCQNVC